MRNIQPVIVTLLLVASACNQSTHSNTADKQHTNPPTFAEARKGFSTRLLRISKTETKAAIPPKELFSVVAYPTNIGDMVAYLGKIPNDGKLHPAIIWITGGFGNTVDNVWDEADPDNDQTAAVFRKAGITMMYPAQRGGNGNPGSDESFFGEIDDILAAANFLAKQKGIDPDRIYLGGHSTGGTKALLAAECSRQFRAVFCFGPVSSAEEYDTEELTYNREDINETRMRVPALWLTSLQTPTFIFEGDSDPSNIAALWKLERVASLQKNQYTHFYTIKDKTHFSVLQPTSKVIAQKILEDDKKGPVTMTFTF